MSVKPVRLIFALLSSMFLPVLARAELKWEQTQLELHPSPSDKEAVGHFKYQNVGKMPIRFKSVHTSCGCTAAQTQKEEVAPGEKGEITATFKIGDRTGIQQKTVTVQTDDPAQPTMVLLLKAVIAQTLEINPIFVYWSAGEEAKPKTISVRAGKDFPAKTLTVTSSNPDFLAKVEPEKSAGAWKINVQPKQTARATAARLTIQSDFPKDAPNSFYVTASVTGVPAATPASVAR